MPFDHAVKYNGKYYPPGAKIEEPDHKQEPAQKAVEAPESAENAKVSEEPDHKQEPAQKAVEAPESAENAKVSEEPDHKQEPAQKAARGRKKGDG